MTFLPIQLLAYDVESDNALKGRVVEEGKETVVAY